MSSLCLAMLVKERTFPHESHSPRFATYTLGAKLASGGSSSPPPSSLHPATPALASHVLGELLVACGAPCVVWSCDISMCSPIWTSVYISHIQTIFSVPDAFFFCVLSVLLLTGILYHTLHSCIWSPLHHELYPFSDFYWEVARLMTTHICVLAVVHIFVGVSSCQR